MSLLTSINGALSALTGAGLSSSDAATAVGALFGSVAAQIKPYLAVIVANPSNAQLVQDNVNKILEVSGLPALVMPLINALPAAAAAATTPTGIEALYSLVSNIESNA